MVTYDNSGVTYDSATYRWDGDLATAIHAKEGGVRYRVVIRDFADTTYFGPGDNIVVWSDALNLGWSEYVNEVSEAFFTISQEDPKIAALATEINEAVEYGKHVEFWRNDKLVWAGWLGETDENYNDIVFTAYSYVSGYYHSLTGWTQEWTAANVSDIVSDAINGAHTNSKSRLGWFTVGELEQLWEVTGGTGGLVLPLYRAPYKRVLTLLREIAAYAISDTSNKVRFEVTPEGIFNLYRDRTSDVANIKWTLGDGLVRSFNRIRLPVDRRNVLVTVGSSPNDTALRATQTDTTQRDAYGLKQEPLYFSWVRDATELDRVGLARLTRASRVDSDLMISFFSNSIAPFRATDADYELGDRVAINLRRGLTQFGAGGTEYKLISGQQVVFRDNREFVRVLLADDF